MVAVQVSPVVGAVDEVVVRCVHRQCQPRTCHLPRPVCPRLKLRHKGQLRQRQVAAVRRTSTEVYPFLPAVAIRQQFHVRRQHVLRVREVKC